MDWISSASSGGASRRSSRRTVSAKRRALRTSSISPARSMASSSWTAISPLRVTRKAVVEVTISPGKKRPDCMATRSSMSMNACSLPSLEIGTRRPRVSGTGIRALRARWVSGSSRLHATMICRPGMAGTGRCASTASGVSNGKMPSSKAAVALASCVGVRSDACSSRMPAAFMAGSRVPESSVYASAFIFNTRSRTAAKQRAGVMPEGSAALRPLRRNSISPPTRTWKNSSRLEAVMAKNFKRSNRGNSSRRASLSTRWLNSSQESSRLR